MAARTPAMAPSAPASAPADRNRRTALALVAWILLLALASILVAWFRN